MFKLEGSAYRGAKCDLIAPMKVRSSASERELRRSVVYYNRPLNREHDEIRTFNTSAGSIIVGLEQRVLSGVQGEPRLWDLMDKSLYQYQDYAEGRSL